MEFTQAQWLYGVIGLSGGLLLGLFGLLLSRRPPVPGPRPGLARQLGQLTREHGEMRQAYGQLQSRFREREAQHRAQVGLLNEHRAQLKQEFENLAHRIFEDRSEQFANHSRQSLETLLQPFREQISQFRQRVDQVHTESVKGHANLEHELRKVLEVGLQMNAQANNLTAALKGDNKAAGSWGEAQLERSLQLAGLQPGEHYEAQAALRDAEGRRRLPDFLVKLPDDKHLVIDSKVSLVDYERAVAAEDEAGRDAALGAHIRAVRRHIDDLARKDYAQLPQLDSPDFVLMFMPVEPAYIEALRHNRELFNYGYQQGVILVSHTTLMPILRTVANLWMVQRSNREAREIGDRAGDIYNQVCLLAQRLQKLGNTLGTASGQYNDVVRALVGKQGLHGKIERFQQLSTRANRSMPAIETVHPDLEGDRLATLEPQSPAPINGESQPRS
jgi:DNA recombination protein RmuC